MPWLLRTEKIDEMTDYVRGLDWAPDTWWRDENALEGWWSMMDYPFGERTFMAAVPSGGCVAWISNVRGSGGEELWTLYAYSLDIGVLSGQYADIAKTPRDSGKGTKLDDRFVTQWTIKADSITPAGKAAQIGDWCACREKDTDGGRFGRVADITEKGWITAVEIQPGMIVAAGDYAKRWFVLVSRDEACAARWSRGETTFRAYIAMLSCLAREQKKKAKLGAAPKMIARSDKRSQISAPTLIHNEVISSAIPESPIAENDKIARLKMLYAARVDMHKAAELTGLSLGEVQAAGWLTWRRE